MLGIRRDLPENQYNVQDSCSLFKSIILSLISPRIIKMPEKPISPITATHKTLTNGKYFPFEAKTDTIKSPINKHIQAIADFTSNIVISSPGIEHFDIFIF